MPKFKIFWEESMKITRKFSATVASDHLPSAEDTWQIVEDGAYEECEIVSEDNAEDNTTYLRAFPAEKIE
jgi:hypothetical protein